MNNIVRMNLNVICKNYCNATQLNNLETTFEGTLLDRSLFGIRHNKKNGFRYHPTQLTSPIQQTQGLYC